MGKWHLSSFQGRGSCNPENSAGWGWGFLSSVKGGGGAAAPQSGLSQSTSLDCLSESNSHQRSLVLQTWLSVLSVYTSPTLFPCSQPARSTLQGLRACHHPTQSRPSPDSVGSGCQGTHSQCCQSGAWLRRRGSCHSAPWPWRRCSPRCTGWWWALQRGPSQLRREASWASPMWGSNPR